MEALKKPYIYWTLIIFFVYIAINLWISGFYNTIPALITYADTINWGELSLSILLSTIIGIFVALNTVTLYIMYKSKKTCANTRILTGVGTMGGLATGICPICITGLFPLVFGLAGISFSFASLPFKGLEIQILTIIILGISLSRLSKEKKLKI